MPNTQPLDKLENDDPNAHPLDRMENDDGIYHILETFAHFGSKVLTNFSLDAAKQERNPKAGQEKPMSVQTTGLGVPWQIEINVNAPLGVDLRALTEQEREWIKTTVTRNLSEREQIVYGNSTIDSKEDDDHSGSDTDGFTLSGKTGGPTFTGSGY
jgi:hypothetical protein